MGRRKSKRKPPRRKTTNKLFANRFRCPFCFHGYSVKVTMNRMNETAVVSCTRCGEEYVTKLTSVMEPLDAYNAWIDACDEANK